MRRFLKNVSYPIPEPEVILSYNGVPVLWQGGKSFICAVAKARKTPPDEEDPFKQSPHETFGEFIPWRFLVPEPKVRYSKEWNQWIFERVTWLYDQREDFCRNCVHAVFYAETKFRCREKITSEEAANQKICRGLQQK